MAAKGPEAFRTISEASDEVGVPSHVLRFWETRFSFIRPMKRAGGRRFYRPQDVAVLRGVRTLLHDEGYTIKGVQKLHKEQGVARVASAADTPLEAEVGELVTSGRIDASGKEPCEPVGGAPRPLLDEPARERLMQVLGDLEGVKARIDALLTAPAG